VNDGNLTPVGPNNRLARTHSFYATALTPIELADVTELADCLRELCPVNSVAMEPMIALLAGQLWRRRRAYADLAANGVVRAKGKPAPILQDLETLERSIADGLRSLGLEPMAAAKLGLTLAQVDAVAGRELDLSRLSAADRSTLERILAIAEGTA
jgi:hypothetical protein